MVKDIFRFWNGNFLFLVAKASPPFPFSLKWASCPLTHWQPQSPLLPSFRIYLQGTDTSFLNINWSYLKQGKKWPWGGGWGIRGVAGDGWGSIELHGFLNERASYFHSLFIKWEGWDEMILQGWQTKGPWVGLAYRSVLFGLYSISKIQSPTFFWKKEKKGI